jgi:hypothetical protein
MLFAAIPETPGVEDDIRIASMTYRVNCVNESVSSDFANCTISFQPSAYSGDKYKSMTWANYQSQRDRKGTGDPRRGRGVKVPEEKD